MPAGCARREQSYAGVGTITVSPGRPNREATEQGSRRITDHAKGFTAPTSRVGMAQDLAKTGAELPALMTAGRWKNSTMPARYTERQAEDRGAVARYYQESGG